MIDEAHGASFILQYFRRRFDCTLNRQAQYRQGRRHREGQWCPAPPFEIGAPHFTFGPPVATYIQYCILKMWPPLLVFGPSFWFLAPLLLHLGDGPEYSAINDTNFLQRHRKKSYSCKGAGRKIILVLPVRRHFLCKSIFLPVQRHGKKNYSCIFLQRRSTFLAKCSMFC